VNAAEPVEFTVQSVRLDGWGVDEQVNVLTLPLPPYPQLLTLTTLDVPGLNEQLRLLRPNQQQTYPDQDGLLCRDGQGQPVTLHLLGRGWPVRAQLDQGLALEIDADLSGAALREATAAALNALDTQYN
jgi:hypothetical protein